MANDYVGWGLVLGIEDGLDEFIDDATEVVNSLGTGIPPRDLAAFSSESTEDGIKLTFTPPGATYLPEHTASDGKQFACMPAGVLIRYSDTGYPRTPDEGKFGYDYKPTGDWVTTSQECTIVGLTKDTKYYFTAFPYSTEHVYNKNQVTANRTEMTWVGNKGTISVTVNTPEGYEGTLGEYTITLVDQASDSPQNIEKTATGAGLTQFGGLTAGKTYKVRLSNTTDLQAPPDSEAITVAGGVNNDVTMTYALMYGTITVNVSTQPAGMPIGRYTVTLTPNDSTGALSQQGNNSQAVVFNNVKNGVVYTVGLSAINHYTANPNGTVTAVGGQNKQHNAHYAFGARMNDLSWDEIINYYRSGFGSLFNIGDTKTTTIGQYEYNRTYTKTGTAQATVVLISKTKFSGLTFFIQKYIVPDRGVCGDTFVGDDARDLVLENQTNMSEELLLPECYQYLVNTTQKQRVLSYDDYTITGKIVVPSVDTVTKSDYLTSDSRRRINDGAYFLTDRDGTSSPADDWNYFVTASGLVRSHSSGYTRAGLTAIFTLR